MPQIDRRPTKSHNTLRMEPLWWSAPGPAFSIPCGDGCEGARCERAPPHLAKTDPQQGGIARAPMSSLI